MSLPNYSLDYFRIIMDHIFSVLVVSRMSVHHNEGEFAEILGDYFFRYNHLKNTRQLTDVNQLELTRSFFKDLENLKKTVVNWLNEMTRIRNVLSETFVKFNALKNNVLLNAAKSVATDSDNYRAIHDDLANCKLLLMRKKKLMIIECITIKILILYINKVATRARRFIEHCESKASKKKINVQDQNKMIVDDESEIGVGMCVLAMGILFLGIMLLFDKGLLALGNIMFIAGLGFTVGFVRCFKFFFQLHKVRGTAFFFSGIIVVLIGWPVVGIIFELYGFYYLFGGFLPTVIIFLRRTPIIGRVLNLPGISKIVEKISGENSGRAMV